MQPIYHIQLTQQEYDYLLRIAPDGIQAAMEATLQVEYPDPVTSTEMADEPFIGYDFDYT